MTTAWMKVVGGLVFMFLLQCAAARVLHMMWTTPAATMQRRHLSVLQSYLHHHPDWQVRLYVSDGHWAYWRELLWPWIARGHDLELILLSDDFLTGLAGGECAVAGKWVEEAAHRSGRFYYSHLTDLLRFCLLVREGGVYSDFDALLLRPLPLEEWLPGPPAGRTVIGKDRVTEACQWCLSGGHYLAPGVMIAERGSVLLRRALEIGFGGEYDPKVFNGVGPRAVTVASKTVRRSAVVILDRELFYPVDWKQSVELFKPQTNLFGSTSPDEALEYIKRRAYSLHFFGAQTRSSAIEPGCIMDRLMGDGAAGDGDDGIVVEGAADGIADSASNRVVAPEYLIAHGTNTRLRGIRWLGVDPVAVQLAIVGGTGTLSRTACLGQDTTAGLNHCLDNIWFSPAENTTSAIVEISAPTLRARLIIYNMPGMLTVAVKTMDRMTKVIELVASLYSFYPNVRVLVANDGADASAIEEGPKRGFYYLPLPYDAGLSASRNAMVDRIGTPLVMVLDDDFVLTADSDLGHLAHQLMRHRLDIAAATSPEDYRRNGFHYAGIIQIHRDEDGAVMEILEGDHGALPSSTCRLVDIVPNIFIARTAALKELRWSDELKLGEHEDFFLRAKGRGTRVATCDTVGLTHRQEPHWLRRTAYDRMRSRVWTFLQRALIAHGLERLRVFGMTTMALQELRPAEIADIQIFDLQPFSVAFEWSCPTAYHLYAVDVFDVTEEEKEDAPGTLVLTHDVEPSRLSPITPRHALVTGLEPNRVYRLLLRPGNHTHVCPEGAEFFVQTPDYHGPSNLLINGDIKGNLYWERSLGAHSGIVPVHYATDRGSGRGDSIPSRPGRFARQQQHGSLGDYAISLYVAAKTDEAAHESGVCQRIPAGELPSCPRGCQVSVGAWARVDRLFGPPAALSLELRLVYVWGDGRRDTFAEHWDPYEETRWQPLAFSTGLVTADVALDAIEVWAWLRTPRGAVFFDDFYLAVRPIIGSGHL